MGYKEKKNRKQRRQSLGQLKCITHCHLSIKLKAKHWAITPAGWCLSVKVHGHLWVTLAGNDHTPGARRGPVSAVGGPGTSCLPAVCDLHYTLMAVHLAILALDISGAADTTNVPDVFMDEGVDVLALTHRHLPSLHHQVAVGVIATGPLRVHVLPQESVVHAILAIGELHHPQQG